MIRRHRAFNLIDHLRNEAIDSNLRRRHYFQHRFDLSTTLYSLDGNGHSGCVNALDFSADGLLLATGGDDKRVLIWNICETLFNSRIQPPTALNATHMSNIFSIKFDNQHRRIISAGNDEQILVHDIEKQHQSSNESRSEELVDLFLESSPINSLSIQPDQNDVFIAGTEDGHVHLYDLRSASSAVEHDQPSIVVAESFNGSFHSCTFHPQQTCLVATANARQGIELYDIRLCKSAVLRYGSSSIDTSSTTGAIEGMSVTFNNNGNLLYALRRQLPPVLYKLHQSTGFCQFDADNYVNLCTMKAGCFVGDHDQYIASGSDDFNVYIWRIPENDDHYKPQRPSSSPLSSDHFVWNSHMILHGHRSVVNQIRYSSRLHTLVSSGVEKIIKMWTPFRTRHHVNDHNKLNGRSELYSHSDYARAVFESGSVHHDSSVERYDEDKRMLAFFDSLLQRELGSGSDDSDDDNDDILITTYSIDEEDLSTDMSALDDDDEEEEEINSQPTNLSSDSTPSSRRPHPTIMSLAKQYRVRYVEKLKQAIAASSSHSEKRSLESPPTSPSKRSRSSSNTLQILRNRIRNEDNEHFDFSNERRLS